MTRIDPYLPEFGAPALQDDEDEGLFSRDISGQLVRLDAPTESDYNARANVWIDAEKVEVPVAEPLKDAQGNIIRDINGRTTPRYTTIYDAAVKLREEKKSASISIPVLCHQSHMTPVAVCRMCMVLVGKVEESKQKAPDGTETTKSRVKPERRLTPACQRVVKDGMHVFTMNAQHREDYVGDKKTVEKAAEQVRQAVEVLHELLIIDHLKPAPDPAPKADLDPFNELRTLKSGYHLEKTRFDVLNKYCSPPPDQGGDKFPPHKLVDRSSLVFLVDHSACILCDRCSRACGEVKNNNIIGRTGKGPTAAIGFDLDEPMGQSGCVQCGECMVSCPTSAITFKPVAKVAIKSDGEKKHPFLTALTIRKKAHKPAPKFQPEILRANDLVGGKEPLFAGVPPKFLLWQEGLVRRRQVEEGEHLCHQGEPGHSAFFLKSGTFRIVVWPKNKSEKPKEFDRGADATILGEMACLSGTARTADIKVVEPGEVLEVRRNVLDRIMRSPVHRETFQKIYSERALREALRESELFKDLATDVVERCGAFLKDRLTFVRVEPGQTIFQQGDWADALYLVRLGHVRISMGPRDAVGNVLYRGPGSVIGEIGLLAIDRPDIPADAAQRKAMIENLDKNLGPELNVPVEALSAALPCGRRTATCSALDHLEMARVWRADFLLLLKEFPAVRRQLIEMAVGRLGQEIGAAGGDAMQSYIEQGLYQAQNLLALDLDKCTRCDECVNACVDRHGKDSHGVKVTRLKRDGLRFGNQLVASSCRSCKDAYCMIGCPVDSIHRGKHGQIVIEDHCIGCGLCERNCPYGNIWMEGDRNHMIDMPDPKNPGKVEWKARNKAATCDLCDADGVEAHPKPRCVAACPHDAAHRMTGEELRTLVWKEKL